MDPGETVLELESVRMKSRGGEGWGGVPGEVSLRVRRGESWLLLGGMGSGKTALMEAMAGLRPVAGGVVRVFGRDMGAARGAALAEVRLRMGFVFEGRGRLFAGLTVLENVALPVCYHRDLDLEVGVAEVGGWMEELGLQGMSGLGVGQLGPAWARRVALARALVLGPELLLLDDPMGGLDAVHARWWRGFLGRLQDGHPRLGGRGVTLVMAAGTADDLRGLAERCAVLTPGGLQDVAPGRPWEVVGEDGAGFGEFVPGD